MSNEHDGHGGSYIIDSEGRRVLVERTEEAVKKLPDTSSSAEQAAQDEPADAGFFSPVAPADQSTTTE